MTDFTKTIRTWRLLTFMAGALCLSSCKDSPENIPQHDPNKPVVLKEFRPTSGPLATKVILEGGNFGSDKDNIRVWFNEKRAAVISAKGDRMLVLAPKLPGEECVISVVVGNDSLSFGEDNLFDYIVQTNVTTLAGGEQASKMPEGTVQLSTAQFNRKPESTLCVDASDNLFIPFDISDNNGGKFAFYLANEEADKLKELPAKPGMIIGGFLIGYNNIDDNVYWLATESGGKDYRYFDHRADFANVSAGSILWDKPITASGWAAFATKVTITMHPSDGRFYFRGNQGQFACFDPATGKGENIGANAGITVPFDGGTTYGLVFDPRDENILYLSIDNRHCIYKYDLRNNTFGVFAGQLNQSGYLDGIVSESMFNNIGQMCVDVDNNIYVADTDNHCIRKISLETGYVSTVAGIPTQPGYQNGEASFAKFNRPRGIAINSEGIIYIADQENYAIRRLAIE